MLHTFKSRAVLAAGTSAVLAGTLLATQQAGATSTDESLTVKTIVLTTKPAQGFKTDVGVKGDSAGDRRTASETVFLAGKKIGQGGSDCIDAYFVDQANINGRLWAMCTQMLNLPGGQIVGQGMIISSKPAKPINLAVVGGTGDYLGKRGSMTIVGTSTGTKITVKLL